MWSTVGVLFTAVQAHGYQQDLIDIALSNIDVKCLPKLQRTVYRFEPKFFYPSLECRFSPWCGYCTHAALEHGNI